MARRDTVAGLLRVAARATRARERFPGAGSLVAAVACGIVLLRLVAYPLVGVFSSPFGNPDYYLAVSFSAIVCLWSLFGALALRNSRTRGNPALFFAGCANARRLTGHWMRIVLLGRPLSIVALLTGLATIIAGIWNTADHSGTVIAWVGIAPVIGHALVSLHAFLSRAASGEQDGLPETVALAVVILVLLGPDYRVAGERMVPVLVGIEMTDVAAPALALPLAPMLLPVLQALARSLVRAGRAHRSQGVMAARFRSMLPLLSSPVGALWRRHCGTWYWLIAGIAALALAAAAADPAAAVAAVTGSGLLYWIGTLVATWEHLRARWGVTQVAPALLRAMVSVSLLHTALHAAFVTAAVLIIG